MSENNSYNLIITGPPKRWAFEAWCIGCKKTTNKRYGIFPMLLRYYLIPEVLIP